MGNVGRFQYTGQTWLPELGMYYFKARIYSPTLGRFLQPDPIGYGDGMNMYAYVGGDPINASDPSGTMAYDDAQAHFADYSEEWEALRGPNLKGPRSRDGLGTSDLVFMAGGRHEMLSYERALAALPGALMKLNHFSVVTGVSTGCLLSVACTAHASAPSLTMAARGVILETLFCIIAVCSNSQIEVYRAVPPNELADIQKTGTYRLLPGGAEGKYFYPSIEQAYKVQTLFRNLGDQKYTVTSGLFTFRELGPSQRAAGEGTFYVVDGKYLPKGPVKIYPPR